MRLLDFQSHEDENYPQIFIFWSVIINEVFIYNNLYEVWWFGKSKFSPFRSIASFHKTGYCTKTSSWRKRLMHFSDSEWENFICFNVVFHFSRSNLDFRTKRKNFFFKKVAKFRWFFLLRNAISPDPLVRFRWFFFQTADNFILFPITKKKVSEFFKFSKKIRNRDFWSKKPPNWQNCKFLT